MKTTTKKTALLTLAAFAVGLAVSYSSAPATFERFFSKTTVHAMWKDHFTSLGDLRDSVDAIVVGEVVAIDEGRVVPYADGDKQLRFTDVTVRPHQSVKGRPAAEITVEVTGDFLGRQEVVFEGVPGFELGETYLLFLNEQEETGSYYVVNNQGGFLVRRGRLEAADPDDELAAELHGRQIAAAVRMIHQGGG